MWMREPLVHFALIALVTWWVAPHPDQGTGTTGSSKESSSPGEDREQVKETLKKRLGTEPDEASIDQELARIEERGWLLEEAIRMELHQGDPEVEERLLNKLGQVVLGALPAPSDEQLREWYRNESSKKAERTVAFTQLFFPRDSSEAEVEKQIAALQAGGDQNIPGVRVGRVASARERGLSRRLPPQVVEHVLNAPLMEWQQVRGTNPPLVVRVDQREVGSLKPFEQVRGEVKGDWERHQRREALRKWIRQSRENTP